MSNIQSVLKIHTRDKWLWIFIPALILFSSFLINLIVRYAISSVEKFYTGGITSIFIYIFVAGILTVTQTFPFALGMSIRRKDFFIGTSIMGFSASIVIGVLIFLFSFIEKQSAGWGTSLHFFYFPYVTDGNPLQQLTIYILLFTCLFFCGFTIASFARRFGGKGMWILAIVSFLLGSIAALLITYYQVWVDIFRWVATHTAIQLALWLIPFVLFYLIASFLLLRKATV